MCNKNQFTCKITFPSVYKRCFGANFFSGEKRNIFPKSLTSTGAYLPAITACTQNPYLPGQTIGDIRQGTFEKP